MAGHKRSTPGVIAPCQPHCHLVRIEYVSRTTLSFKSPRPLNQLLALTVFDRGTLQALFDQLSAAGYHLSEAEAKVFLPGLVEKSGQPQVMMPLGHPFMFW